MTVIAAWLIAIGVAVALFDNRPGPDALGGGGY